MSEGQWLAKVMDAGAMRTRSCKSWMLNDDDPEYKDCTCEGSGRNTKVWMKLFSEEIQERRYAY